ncbi:acyl-CoA/acyl-ACP dehydrogenase [Sphingomonas rhizophila]|uniref:Dibenzothiophene monooxygenase n=1 Tax=Sphingomonas rhizophila TaxID=2071607 RepID=A0A7G9S8U7_9SPHN|nr:acyl-CoA dehydrogenase family protein [Sphingomonas rhizophila]QNN64272.1 acyl-CoA/acyl-ACP dehydrogenase [Sphingomonas rhizophila]
MLNVVGNLPMTVDWTDTATAIAARIADCATAHDADDSFVAEGFDALEEAGFFAALVPAELGGGGASVGEICDAIRIIGASCGSTALAAAMHSHIVAVAAWRWQHMGAPTDGLMKRIVAEKLKLVSSGGSDWLKSAGTMEKVEGGYRLTARKAFASGSPTGDLLMTSAVYDDPEEGPTVLHFAAPLKGEGVSIASTWQTMGMRGTGSDDVVFDGVFIPDAGIAGKRPQGEWHMLFHIVSMIAFALIYAAYVGVAEGARTRALELARKRPADPMLAQLAGEMENALLTARLAHRRMVEIAETGTPGPETTSEAMQLRTLVGRNAIDTVAKAMEVAGGAAFYRKVGLERAFRDIQAARFHPMQEKPQLDFTGRVALGWDING